MNDLSWLMDWYASQCNGKWEHGAGITLQTLDNPGWSLTIDLGGTALETRVFALHEHSLKDSASWWVCEVRDKTFLARCGPRDLLAILAIFRTWAEASN